jgi:hypothetical protein
VLLAQMHGTALPSRANIARRFGLSKTQVTRIVTGGAERGFFSLDVEGVPAATPKARVLYHRWVALELAFYAEHMQPQLACHE